MTATELIKRLEANGWIEVRQSGSHRIYKHPVKPDNISVPDHGVVQFSGTLNLQV
jgi:predicted RNA binding protein YcfA (HicA-like mRNA interferase family)